MFIAVLRSKTNAYATLVGLLNAGTVGDLVLCGDGFEMRADSHIMRLNSSHPSFQMGQRCDGANSGVIDLVALFDTQRGGDDIGISMASVKALVAYIYRIGEGSMLEVRTRHPLLTCARFNATVPFIS